jgi:hypothetical protein
MTGSPTPRLHGAPSARRALLQVIIEIDPGTEIEFNRWYDEKHVPERLAMNGFISAHRFVSDERPDRYLTIYELEEAEAATGDAYMEAARRLEDDWDRSVAQHWRLIGREVWTDIPSDLRGEPAVRPG